MITIFTDGQQLDLDPSGSFELTYEQPMLDDTHAPVPFSTSIGLLPTPNNKKILGFLDAMLLEPNVRRLQADIFVGGFKILSGILVYDGYEDGVLNYSFSGKNLEDDWSGKIWTLVNPTISTIPAQYTITRKLEFIRSMKNGGHFLAAPILVNKNAVAKTVYDALSSYAEKVDPSIKYHNWPNSDYVIFSPVFRMNLIIEKILKKITLDNAFSLDLGDLAIIAQYKPDGHFNQIGIPLLSSYDCQKMLPDLSVYQVVQNLARMFCAALYRDGERYRFLAAKTVLNSDTVLDWSDKVSTDEYSLGKEPATSYILKYENSDEDNTYDVTNLSSDLEDGDITTYSSFKSLIAAFGTTELKAVRHAVTKDIYSGRRADLGNENYVTNCDMIYHHNPAIDTSSGEEESSFDNSIEFNLVRCIPEAIASGTTSQFKLAPIIDAPTIGEARGTDVYIGVMANNQLVDKGYSFTPLGADANLGVSLATDVLFDKYHAEFADWLSKDRQTLSADLKLSIRDVVEFRMYNKVRFASRTWLVKKLTLNFAIDSDHIEATGEFVAL